MNFEKKYLKINQYICRLFVSRVITYAVAVLITICLSGKVAILFKKFIENQNDNTQVLPILVPHNIVSSISHTPPIIIPTSHQNNNFGMNNQHWNHYLCGNFGTTMLIFAMFLLIVCNYMMGWWILDLLNLSKDTSVQMFGIFNQFIVCNVIPLVFYLTNDKLYQHVKNEFF